MYNHDFRKQSFKILLSYQAFASEFQELMKNMFHEVSTTGRSDTDVNILDTDDCLDNDHAIT